MEKTTAIARTRCLSNPVNFKCISSMLNKISLKIQTIFNKKKFRIDPQKKDQAIELVDQTIEQPRTSQPSIHPSIHPASQPASQPTNQPFNQTYRSIVWDCGSQINRPTKSNRCPCHTPGHTTAIITTQTYTWLIECRCHLLCCVWVCFIIKQKRYTTMTTTNRPVVFDVSMKHSNHTHTHTLDLIRYCKLEINKVS